MKENDRGNYWRDIAYSSFGFGEIFKPDKKGKLDTYPRYEVRDFIESLICNIETEGDILDLGCGVNTGFYFGGYFAKRRKLIGLDIAPSVFEISKKSVGQHRGANRAPDYFIDVDLNKERLKSLPLQPNSVILASLIDSWRYLNEESFRNIASDLMGILKQNSIFVTVDFEGLKSKPYAQEIGEIRRFTSDEVDKTMDFLEDIGYKDVEFWFIKNEKFPDINCRAAITARKLS